MDFSADSKVRISKSSGSLAEAYEISDMPVAIAPLPDGRSALAYIRVGAPFLLLARKSHKSFKDAALFEDSTVANAR